MRGVLFKRLRKPRPGFSHQLEEILEAPAGLAHGGGHDGIVLLDEGNLVPRRLVQDRLGSNGADRRGEAEDCGEHYGSRHHLSHPPCKPWRALRAALSFPGMLPEARQAAKPSASPIP